MNRRQFTKFSYRLTQVLGEGTITRLGSTTGFTHRLREVTLHRMAGGEGRPFGGRASRGLLSS